MNGRQLFPLWACFLASISLSPSLSAQKSGEAEITNPASSNANAAQLLDSLLEDGASINDALVIAINGAPQAMAGELTLVAMDRVPTDQHEEIGYLALTSSSGVGLCKVAEVIGMTPPSICADLDTAPDSAP